MSLDLYFFGLTPVDAFFFLSFVLLTTIHFMNVKVVTISLCSDRFMLVAPKKSQLAKPMRGS